MNICALLGSPRKEGNTAHVLNWILEEAKNNGHKVDLVYLQDQKISGCRECFACQKIVDRPGCSIKDDMQRLYPKILEADCIIIASPVFCYYFSAQIKLIFDRIYCLIKRIENGKYISLLKGKLCGLVITAGSGNSGGADIIIESYQRIIKAYKMKDIGHIAALNISTKKGFAKPDIKQRAIRFGKRI